MSTKILIYSGRSTNKPPTPPKLSVALADTALETEFLVRRAQIELFFGYGC
ncbi:hypothetical protein [Microcoleus sp.]|uniref:hypothetical protein n=1 Tax=Microcoleus sp. TaxID=44472 RepID=UPI0035937C4B